MSAYNEFRLRCKARSIVILCASLIALLILLAIPQVVNNNIALNFIYELAVLCTICMFASLAILLWYIMTCLVVPVFSKKNVSGAIIKSKYIVSTDVKTDKFYNIQFVRGLIYKRFVVNLEETNE